ncbi:MAG: TIGR03943 family protein [Chloroflexota bacterium]
MQNQRIQVLIKALLLIGLGLFLYSRLTNGTLFYYINQRFAGLTLLAILGLIVLGISYQMGRKESDEDGDHAHDDHHGHHHDHHDHDHNHSLSWVGALIVALPIILGLAVPPEPLDASAVANREVDIGASTANANSRSAMPAAVRAAQSKSSLDKNILDWLRTFQSTADPIAEVEGEAAQVRGFVYPDDNLTDGDFWVARYTLSCCVADAGVVALGVRLGDDNIDTDALTQNQWVEITGTFAPGEHQGMPLPILVAESVRTIDVPSQPYLYP